MENNNKFKVVVFSVILLLFIFLILYFWVDAIEIKNSQVYNYVSAKLNIVNKPETVKDIYVICKNDNLGEYVQCSQKYIMSIWNFKIRTSEDYIPFEQLIEDGGDCSDWSNIWTQIAELNDNNHIETDFKITETFSHRISILSNEKEYCIIDGINIDCREVFA